MRYHLIPDAYKISYFVRDIETNKETMFSSLEYVFNKKHWFDLSSINNPPILTFDTLYTQEDFNRLYPELFI